MFHFLTALTIFISAYLLFFIQPLLAKSLLPTMGGSATVWLAGMLFFQTGLLCGYGYAYLLTRFFKERLQIFIHFGLIVASFYFIPVTFYEGVVIAESWQPLLILKLYATRILLPFMVLSATSPLFQYWYYRLKQTDFPYYFYSISNAGSLIGLIGYPFLLEPFLGIEWQGKIWSVLYGGYALLALLCLIQVFKKAPQLPSQKPEAVAHKGIIKWIALAFLGCSVFLAATQFLSQNVINLPLMWVLPLALYLLSFIVTFAKPKGYERTFWFPCFLIWLMLMMWLIWQQQLAGLNVVIVLLALQYSACMICHGELIRLKPPAHNLTLFYFYIALGGVLGGIFVSMVAPFIFNNWWDFYLPLIFITLLIFLVLQKGHFLENKWLFLNVSLCVLAMGMIGMAIFQDLGGEKATMLTQIRNPYGMIKVLDKTNRYPYRALMHGKIMHGFQYQTTERKDWPTSYYGQNAGVGLALQFLRENRKEPLQIGVVGLGTGTLATYGKAGDSFDFFEIDKDIILVAKQYFSFLKDSPAIISLISGDARLELAKRQVTYDLIVVDAFSGDVIPFHLLTKEAFSLYVSKLNQNGIIAFNTTNTYLTFLPVIAGLAPIMGCNYEWIYNKEDLNKGVFPSSWALFSCDPHFAPWLAEKELNLRSKEGVKGILWTDDKNSILPLLKF